MSFLGLLNQEVTIITMVDGAEDAMGNLEPTAGPPVIVQGRLQQSAPEEVTLGRDTALSDWVAYLPADADVAFADTLTVGGRTWQVVGSPYPVQTPGGTHHLQVRCRLLEE